MAFDNKKKFRAKVTHCRFLGLCLFFTLVIIPHQIILNKKSFIIIFLIFRKFRINSKKSRNPDPFFQRKILIKNVGTITPPTTPLLGLKSYLQISCFWSNFTIDWLQFTEWLRECFDQLWWSWNIVKYSTFWKKLATILWSMI